MLRSCPWIYIDGSFDLCAPALLDTERVRVRGRLGGVRGPASLGARILRQAVFVDADLTASMLQEQLVQRVMLFAPERAGGLLGLRGQRPEVKEVLESLEAAVAQLCKQASAAAA